MTKKRFRQGKSILTDFPTGAIIDEKTGERYYDGIKPSYISSKELVEKLNELYEKKEQLEKEKKELKQELSEYKNYVFSDNEILCYTCVNCLKKGIYKVECSEKGKVDVHSSCFAYWKKELEE